MIRIKLIVLNLCLCTCIISAQSLPDAEPADTGAINTPDTILSISADSLTEMPVLYAYDEVLFLNDSVYSKLILDSSLLSHLWDTVPQPKFWRKMMNLPKDSAFMNVYNTRVIVDRIHVDDFMDLTDDEKEDYRNKLRKKNNLSDSTRILFSTGKQYFYQFEKAITSINGSIPVFVKNGVDPWYAQSILLIESPNKLQKSNAGAYGPFQLMKYIARKYGLTINKYKDERQSLERSAYAASQFLKKICIPTARTMLDTLNIEYKTDDLWFKLLVMHVYHAGGGNVSNVMSAINPTEGGMELIFKIWKTQVGKFKNASQNYSQVILAAHMELQHLVQTKCQDKRKADMAQSMVPSIYKTE